jgi:FkbM family methyltransferase
MPAFLPSLKQSGHLDRMHITLCNVGSRKLSQADDYASHGWGLFAPNLSIYGFDADADACDVANADLVQRQITWTEQHIPLALGKSIGESTLYVTKNPMCSSLYLPNEPYLARFAGLPELVNLDFTIELETTTLDAFCQSEAIETVDFLQVDVQGADLQVLEGASHLLKHSILGIQIEVEFSHLYVDQPLFADVDHYLRSQEFTLFDLACTHRVRARSPIVSHRRPGGQLLWADAFYLCDLLQPIEMIHSKSPQQLLKLACIADVMGFADYALELLEHLTMHHGQDPAYNFADTIVDGLTQIPELVEQGIEQLAVVTRLRDHISPSKLKQVCTH